MRGAFVNLMSLAGFLLSCVKEMQIQDTEMPRTKGDSSPDREAGPTLWDVLAKEKDLEFVIFFKVLENKVL